MAYKPINFDVVHTLQILPDFFTATPERPAVSEITVLGVLWSLVIDGNLD